MRLFNIKQMLMNYTTLQHGFYAAEEGMDKFEERHEEFIRIKSTDLSDLHKVIGENGAKEMFRYGRPGDTSADQETFTAGSTLGIISHQYGAETTYIYDLRKDINEQIIKLRSIAQAHFEDDYLTHLLDINDLEWITITDGLKKALIYEAITATVNRQLSEDNVEVTECPTLLKTPIEQ